MDALTLRALEWPHLLDRIAAHAVSDAGAFRLRTTEPADSIDAARELARRVRDAVELDASGQALPLRAFPDVTEAVGRAQKGGTLRGNDLAGIARLLAVAHDVRVFTTERRERFPHLSAAVTSEATLDPLGRALATAIEPDGTLSDDASPELREARGRARDARESLKERIEHSLKTHADLLQGRYYTERDGRYVIPVRADAHLRVEGIVLGSSASGGTLFVEPREATEQGNKLKLKLAAVEREEERVLEGFSRAVAERGEQLLTAFAACVEADRLSALALFARHTRAEVIEPSDDTSIDLRAARHPLLLLNGVPVVANDVRVRGGRALVISGPNAGGKSVALKCLGLAAWMVRSGIPLPVAPESHVGWFGAVLADIGDEQSIEHSLSTFSAHVTRLREIVERAAPGTLVLLDEVASGTDPEEGAALAAAVLETLTARGAAAAVTTHYERLKELAAANDAFENASVSFDFERMEPTFRLVLGVPGPSSALAVAARFGLDRGLLARAHELLPKGANDREAAVHRLERERAGLERERAELRGELAIAAAIRADLERDQQQQAAAADLELGREARELTALVRTARNEIREAQKRLREPNLDAGALRETERAVSRAAAHVALGGTLDRRAASGGNGAKLAPLPLALAAGNTVRLKKLGTLAIVEAAPERGQVRLRAGGMKLTVALEDVELAKPGTRVASAPTPKRAKSTQPALAVAVRTPSNTLDLRGQRVEEALDRVDAFLDLMMGEGEPLGFVLHGHGTGAMKLAVRAHLSASRYIEHSRPAEADEGGDAFTIFWMKN